MIQTKLQSGIEIQFPDRMGPDLLKGCHARAILELDLKALDELIKIYKVRRNMVRKELKLLPAKPPTTR